MSFLYNILPASFDEKIETKNLLLRPYQEGDEADFMRLIQETQYILNPAFDGRLARVKALDDARSQVQQLRTAWDNRRTFDFGVWLKKTDSYIGNIAIKNLDHKIPKAEIALYFTAWPETKDYAQEALQHIIKFAFDTMALNKVFIRCTPTNEYYGDLALNCGFVKEGTFRNDFRGSDSDELLDLTYYGMTRPDYEEQRHKTTQQDSAALA
jgi:[ribosomal protein S5]-alanine N-acetyltransferase